MSHTSPLDASDKQSHYQTSRNPNHHMERKHHTQHHGTTTAKAFNSSYKRTHHNYTSTWQQQHKSKETRRLRTPSRTTSCTPTSSHTTACDRLRSIYTCLPEGLRARSTTTTLWRISSQLYTATNKKIPVYGIKYVPYQQDNFRIMMPYYVCDVTYPILSASRLLDRGYGLDFNPRHCTIIHKQQQAHLISHSGLCYLRAEKIDISTGFDIYPMTTDNGKSIAVIQPTEKAKQQQEQIAPLHAQTKACDPWWKH